ncbi:hypothetical protein GC174_08995 [bacterium]|nr:hypothetical protein [bacterium]
MSSKPSFRKLAVLLSLGLFSSTAIVVPSESLSVLAKTPAVHRSPSERLERGEVLVGLKNVGAKKYVTGRIIISHPIEKVWPVMGNPYEFENNISPGMQNLEVLTDTAGCSVMKVTIKNNFPIPLPPISYTVKSHYSHKEDGSFIEFKRMNGTFRDFHGFWQAKSVNGGSKTEVLYSMYLDTGFYVPQWIVRKGVSGELPKTLNSLRDRVDEICALTSKPLTRSISAALPTRLSSSSQLYASKHL